MCSRWAHFVGDAPPLDPPSRGVAAAELSSLLTRVALLSPSGGVATVTPFLFISLFCLSGWMGWPPPTTVVLFCEWVLGCPLFVPFPYCFYVCLMGDGWPPSSCLGVR